MSTHTDLEGLYRRVAGYFSKNQGGEEGAGAWGKGIQTSALLANGHFMFRNDLSQIIQLLKEMSFTF